MKESGEFDDIINLFVDAFAVSNGPIRFQLHCNIRSSSFDLKGLATIDRWVYIDLRHQGRAFFTASLLMLEILVPLCRSLAVKVSE